VLLNLLVEHVERKRAVARHDVVKLTDAELRAEAPPASVRNRRISS